MIPLLADAIVVIVSLVIGFLLHKRFGEDKALTVSMTDSYYLAQTLAMSVHQEMIDQETAQFVYNMWWHQRDPHDAGMVDCACGKYSLHCDATTADFKGIRHTTKWCDVVPSNEEK